MTSAIELLPPGILSTWKAVVGRKCGECSLCCKILPVQDANLDKAHGVRCKHQRRGGCKVYAFRPQKCAQWSCGWLLGIGVDGLSRPDRAGYIIDPVADYTTVSWSGRAPFDLPAVVVWTEDRESWMHDEELKKFFVRWAEQGFSAIVRYSPTLAVCVFPPPLTDGGWIITDPVETKVPLEDAARKFARVAAAMGKK